MLAEDQNDSALNISYGGDSCNYEEQLPKYDQNNQKYKSVLEDT